MEPYLSQTFSLSRSGSLSFVESNIKSHPISSLLAPRRFAYLISGYACDGKYLRRTPWIRCASRPRIFTGGEREPPWIHSISEESSTSLGVSLSTKPSCTSTNFHRQLNFLRKPHHVTSLFHIPSSRAKKVVPIERVW